MPELDELDRNLGRLRTALARRSTRGSRVNVATFVDSYVRDQAAPPMEAEANEKRHFLHKWLPWRHR